MHLCLSCNQPCNLSSVFCDSCRISLLERRDEERQEEQLGLISAGSVAGAVDLASASQVGAGEQAHQTEASREVAPVRQTEGEYEWSWNTSGLYKVEGANDEHATALSSVALAPPRPARRVMPKRVRRALLIFIIVGALALTIDGILLALSVTRHHSSSLGVSTVQPPKGSKPVLLTPLGPVSTASLATATASVSADAFTLSASRLSFVANQGQEDPASQQITLRAGSKNAFSWKVSLSSSPAWLKFSSLQGSAVAGATPHLVVSVKTAQLAPKTYTAQAVIKAFDSKGQLLPDGLQPLSVTLLVQVPCSLSVTPTTLTFSGMLLSAPAPQTLTLKESGNCTFPVSWSVSANATWVTFTQSSGSDSGAGSSIIVHASSSGKLIGSYNAQITLVATDSNGLPLVGSPIKIAVKLTVVVG